MVTTTLLAETLAEVVIAEVELIALRTFEAKLNPDAFKLLPVMLPVALITPVTNPPVVVTTTTFVLPPMVKLTFPFATGISTEVDPLVILSPIMLPLNEALPTTVKSPVITEFPPTLSSPAVIRFAPTTLPEALILPGLKRPTVRVPAAIILPLVEMPVVPSS